MIFSKIETIATVDMSEVNMLKLTTSNTTYSSSAEYNCCNSE